MSGSRRPAMRVASRLAMRTAGLAWAVAAGVASAQSAAPAVPPVDGARLAAEGVPARGIAPCASCHGGRGEGNAAAAFPRLAGQPVGYLAHQMRSFVDGSRPSDVMTPIAKALDAAEQAAVSQFYARLPPTGPNGPRDRAAQTDARAVSTRGERLALVGDEAAGIQGCVNCHGPRGTGLPPVFPALAGQHAEYLAQALKAWRGATRTNDASGQMGQIARRLDDADITALSLYFAAQDGAPRR